MPVNITTTKEERIERLVKELHEGLRITRIEVSADSYGADDILGRRHSFLARRRVTAELEIISDDQEDTYRMLMMLHRGGY